MFLKVCQWKKIYQPMHGIVTVEKMGGGLDPKKFFCKLTRKSTLPMCMGNWGQTKYIANAWYKLMIILERIRPGQSMPISLYMPL